MARIVGFIFLGVGLILAPISYYSYRSASHQVATWQPTEADIEKTRIEISEHRETRREGSRERTVTVIRYRPIFTVRYLAAGQTQTSDVVPVNLYSSQAEAERAAEQMSGNGRMQVFFNPDQPTETALKVGWNLDTFLVPLVTGILGVVFTGVGTLLLFLMRR